MDLSPNFIDSAYLFVSLYRDEIRLVEMALMAGGLIVSLISAASIIMQGAIDRR